MGSTCSYCSRSASNENESKEAPSSSSNVNESCSSLLNEKGNEKACSSFSNEKAPSSASNADKNENAIELPEANHLDELISFIEERLKAISIDKAEGSTSKAEITSTSSSAASSMKYGGYLLENVLNRVKKHAFKTIKFQAWVTAGLAVVAYVLDQIDKVSSNRRDCVQFLRYMCALAKHVKELLDHNLPQEKLYDVVEFIVKGSVFCVSKMQSSNLSSFFSASLDVEEMKTLQSQLSHKYSELTLEVVIQILNLMPTPLPPSQGEDPHGVGINEARNKVIELLNMKDDSTRAVVLYGVGGIGKTTLATAVFSSLNLIAYKHCRIDIEQYCSESDLQRLQRQLLRDLFGKNIELRSCAEGREQLSNAFRESVTQPVFLFIDNALRGSDLAKLLPEDHLSDLPKRSRILVTTRKLDQTDMLDQPPNIQRHSYSVNILSHLDAKKLLCRRALGNADDSFEKNSDIDRLVKMCGGIPLVLLFAGSKLRKLGNNASACNNTISFLEQSLEKGEGGLSEKVVGEVYNSLEEDLYKEAFLDIAAFFNKWEKRKVGYIVGEVALKALEEAALVTITEQGNVNLHDIVLARGRKLSEMDRITGFESFQNALEDTKRLQKLKGIWLPDAFRVEAKHLDMMNRSLRVLFLGRVYEFDGESKKKFPNLRFLHAGSSLAMELKEFENLAVLEWGVNNDENFGNLRRLEELSLSLVNATTLPDSFGQLKSLKILNLTSSKLRSLPDSFGQLNCLEELNISSSRSLMSLPQSFSRLSRLKKLNMSDCQNLSRLPDKFSELTSVCAVGASICPGLNEKEMDKFAEMKSLLVLNIEGSPMLIKRWREIKETRPLLVMDGRENFFWEWDLRRNFEETISSALFHEESRFLGNDGDVHLADWSSSNNVALLLTMCDLSSPSNNVALAMVKEKIGELASQGFHILYIPPMGEWQLESEELIRKSLAQLPRGTQAWIAADERSNKLFGYSVYRLVLNPTWSDMFSIIEWSRLHLKIPTSVHTMIASASLSSNRTMKRAMLTP
ncbi:hypothetical protein KI387_034499 [Taxus chinensis]|uniref:Uncharacterized protein n=1 Tax=Taxus chinensis TaxID=29808 RepID=A0AA38F6Y9_TAXCH|nr:hypothetical protein KI387_034499 [Taxus chinensis]